MYDVGQWVHTPKGDAMVVSSSQTWVSTDRGAWPVGKVSPVLDVEAITASQETLEEWLESNDDGPPRGAVKAVPEACRCDCGRAGNCHVIMHVRQDTGVGVRVAHGTITSACVCLMRLCPCTV